MVGMRPGRGLLLPYTTIYPPILHPHTCVKPYPPRSNYGDPISYVCISSGKIYVGQDVGMIEAGYGMAKH